jgi:hypothetical protein
VKATSLTKIPGKAPGRGLCARGGIAHAKSETSFIFLTAAVVMVCIYGGMHVYADISCGGEQEDRQIKTLNAKPGKANAQRLSRLDQRIQHGSPLPMNRSLTCRKIPRSHPTPVAYENKRSVAGLKLTSPYAPGTACCSRTISHHQHTQEGKPVSRTLGSVARGRLREASSRSRALLQFCMLHGSGVDAATLHYCDG